MFALKKFVGVLVMPLTIALLLVIVACVLRILRRYRASTVLFVITAVFVYFSSAPICSRLLLVPLVKPYPTLSDSQLPDVKFVVVLGSWYGPRGDIPLTAAFDADGLSRIVEGIRLHRKLPGSRLLLSGGAVPVGGGRPPARGYARLAEELGLAPGSIEILDNALDTSDEARNIAARLQGAPFLLVTSSHHMARAMALMKRAGAQAIPAPATGRPGGVQWADWIPDSNGLRATERAIHEYMGLAVIAMGLD